MRTAPQQAVMVGPHVVLPGSHLEGESLPAAHPLRIALPGAASEAEPEAYVEQGYAPLRLRRHCAWGLPGRNPYRGSVVQALQTATLSSTVVKQIAADIQAGKRVDRVDIRNDGIRARRSGREFNPQHVAMTYGMTMCVDTRVNFISGHSEAGDLYEAMDDDGRIYAVMVPDACGNVSVLGQRYVSTSVSAAFMPTAAAPGLEVTASTAPAGSAADGIATAGVAATAAADSTAQSAGHSAGTAARAGAGTGKALVSVTTDDTRPWLRLAPEDRIRELPRALRFTEDPSKTRNTRAQAAGRGESTVDAPGTLALSGLALALAWLFARKRSAGR
ncbi:MAG TPA: hypothetical protein VK570_14820 [Rubrivivax sp.]|nr:hypothetical protein [Rubrivivax sp.]